MKPEKQRRNVRLRVQAEQTASSLKAKLRFSKSEGAELDRLKRLVALAMERYERRYQACLRQERP